MKNCLSNPPVKRGFTLVEMLVVISIIALLAAILFPVFGRVREGARTTSCSNNLRQLGLGFRQYVQDTGRFPGAGQYQVWGNGGHWVAGGNDTDGGSAGKLACVGGCPAGDPTGMTANVEAGAIFPYVKEAKVYFCPSNPTGQQKRLSYSMNCAINGMSDIRIKEPTNIVLLTDEEKANDGYLYTGSGSTDAITIRHNGGGNLLFADGHVKFYTYDGFPLDDKPAGVALKVDMTPGKVRYEDKAFGAKGYFEGATAFGSCGAPAAPASPTPPYGPGPGSGANPTPTP